MFWVCASSYSLRRMSIDTNYSAIESQDQGLSAHVKISHEFIYTKRNNCVDITDLILISGPFSSTNTSTRSSCGVSCCLLLYSTASSSLWHCLCMLLFPFHAPAASPPAAALGYLLIYVPRLLGVAQNPLASLVVYTPLGILGLPGSVEVR
jgi:hypothetical protein